MARWLVKAKTQKGDIRSLHVSGPETEAEVRACRSYQNWEVLSVERTERGPLKKGELDASAYEAGIKKELNQSRRR
jgi:hypothetical protein